MLQKKLKQGSIAELDQLDTIAGSLVGMYARAEATLQADTAARLAKGLSAGDPMRALVLSQMREVAQTIQEGLAMTVPPKVEQVLGRAGQLGAHAALGEIAEAYGVPPMSLPKPGTITGVATGSGATPSVTASGKAKDLAYKAAFDTSSIKGTLGSLPAAVALTTSLTSQLEDAAKRILRYPDDIYRKATALASQMLLLGLDTQSTAQKKAWQNLVSSGVKGFTDKTGREWNLSSYVEMASRTAVRRAWDTQHTDTMLANGVEFCTIIVGNGACEDCADVSGKIYRIEEGKVGGQQQPNVSYPQYKANVKVAGTLDEAVSHGWRHPNCRCRVVAYLPGLSAISDETTYDPDAEKDRAKLRDLERQTRKAKQSAEHAVSPSAKAQASARVRTLQSQIREHTEATGLARQPARERIDLGHKPGPAVPAPQLLNSKYSNGLISADQWGDEAVKLVKGGQTTYLKITSGQPAVLADTLKAKLPPSWLPKSAAKSAPPKATGPKASYKAPVPHTSTDWVGMPKPELQVQLPTPPTPFGPKAFEEWLDKAKARFAAHAKATGSTKTDLTKSLNWSKFQEVINSGDTKSLVALKKEFYLDDALYNEGVLAIKKSQSVAPALAKAYEDQLRVFQAAKDVHAVQLAEWRKANGITNPLTGMDTAVRHTTDQQGIAWAGKALKTAAGAARDAVKRYTGSSYHEWNAELRRARGGAVGPSWAKHTADADKAFAPAPEDVILHRGTSFKEFGAAGNMPPPPPESLVGTVQTQWGYASTSVGNSSAFAGKPVQLKIKVPAGHPITWAMPYSNYKHEREVLLSRGTHYFVHATYKQGNKWIVEIEVLPPGVSPEDLAGAVVSPASRPFTA